MSRQIYLNKVTGFNVIDKQKPIIIRDKRGLLFYSTEPMIPRVAKFNLPKGFTLIVESGHFERMDSPVVYNKLVLPKKDRDKKVNPSSFKLAFMKNPSKVTIDWGAKTIIFDNGFLEKPIPDIYWALFHEYGHQFWNDGEQCEMNCDEFAVNKMLEFGFNPHQCGSAILHTINQEDSIRRKENLIKKIIKTLK